MRLIALLFLIVGVGLGGGAAYYAWQQVEAQKRAAAITPDGPKIVNVVAAKEALPYGLKMDFERAKKVLKFVQWPEDAVPENAFQTAKELFGENLDQERIITRAVEPGELLLKSKVTGFGESIRIATQVREGMRVFTIPINEITGAAGFISPGDYVDILYVRREADNQMSSHILLQKVLVVATDQQTSAFRTGGRLARTATVEVTREDAQRLTLAMRTGSLSLLLRGVEETETTDKDLTVDTSSLPGAEKMEPEVIVKEVEVIKEVEKEPSAPVDTGYNVRVRKGVEVRTERFE